MTLIRYRNEFSRWLASTLHIEIFPREVYQFSSIPAEVIPHDVAIICISAFLICSLAALIPAYFAARLDPVNALLYERSVATSVETVFALTAHRPVPNTQ